MKLTRIYSVIFLAGLSLLLAGCLPVKQPSPLASSLSPEPTTEAVTPEPAEETPIPEAAMEPEAEATPDKTDEELIKEAFIREHPDWDLTQMDFTVRENTGEFATGSVGPKGGGPGGGMFFAANTTAGWVIAWDGNGTIECSDIEPYSFPTSMIPECYNSLTQEVMVR